MLELKSKRRKEVRMGPARSALVDINKGRAFPPDGFGSFWKQNRFPEKARVREGAAVASGAEKMVCLERNLKEDEKESQEAGVGVAIADSASKKGEYGFLSTEFCFTSTHPREAVVSFLARQEARRMSTAR